MAVCELAVRKSVAQARSLCHPARPPRGEITMRKAQWLAAACVLGFAAGADAQFPHNAGQQFPQYPYPGGGIGPGAGQGFMPNIYNPQYQPLSPYLNLNRGGNPAVNYYYGVRPGTVGGAGSFGAAALAAGGNRPLFFPQVTQVADPELPEPTERYVLPPAGHPVVFNNTLGYYPVPFGQRGAGSRTGLQGAGAGGGAGASRPAGKK